MKKIFKSIPLFAITPGVVLGYCRDDYVGYYVLADSCQVIINDTGLSVAG